MRVNRYIKFKILVSVNLELSDVPSMIILKYKLPINNKKQDNINRNDLTWILVPSTLVDEKRPRNRTHLKIWVCVFWKAQEKQNTAVSAHAVVINIFTAMTSPIVNPDVPYVGEIPDGLVPGKMCRIQGVTHPEADRFNINLATGPNRKPRDDTALHISVRLNQGYIARNSYKDGTWGDEQGSGKLPIGQAQSWEILILVDQNDYKLAINGQHFCEFPFRIPLSELSHILIDGDVTITLISWEGITGVAGGESSAKAAQLNAEGPQGIPPQMGPQGGYGPPPGGYGPPPGYGQPGGYGPPPPGYGVPPPPGAHEESGFSDFLEQAQSVLAGAIRTGAAEKILGGLLGGGEQRHQGYAPQNAKYGIYPDLPPDLNVDPKDPRNQTSQRPGPVQSLLTSFLSGGNRQPQQPTSDPNTQNQTQAHQGPDLVSLLSGLLSNKQQTNAGQQENTQTSQHNPQQPQTQGSDITSMLAGLLSGGNQHQASSQQNTSNPYIPGSEISQNQRSQSVDLNSIISNLLSGGQGKQHPPDAPPPAGYTPTQTQSQGLDLSGLLSSLLGPQPGPQHSDDNPPQGGPNNSSQQSGGINLNSLLSSLLAGGGGHPPQSGGYTPQPPPSAPQSGGYTPHPQSGGYTPQPQSGGVAPPTGGQSVPKQPQQGNSDPSKPASSEPYEDVTDQLEQLMAKEGIRGQQSAGGQSQQYGQYPHPQQNQAGPMESLLSGLLSGGGSQHSGQGSMGNLGSMGGLLQNFAGSILNPKEPGHRPNY
ncbi:unnamed protein product [Acanthoscelides obtectus]|uniref:Galectin domain-containing protein n=1 Tax=Acanthoscelides obtectus TaxID=200917 RepID=A0A9P0K1U1_ACAOB|nr:unnamed protein product [Acanthoscelides obtectus]CAK1658646.1 Galectin-4 [Acanthoscelides obtectus]